MASILLLPLVILGGFAAIVALVVYAIVKNRPGIVAAIGGGFLLLIVLGGVALFGVRSVSHVPSGEWQIGPTGLQAEFDRGPTGASTSRRTSVNVSWIGALFIIAIPLALLFALFRSVTSNKPGCERGGGGGWIGAVLALAILGFVGLFGAKWYAAKRSYHVAQQEMAVARVAEMRAAVMQQQNEIQRQTAEMDIHTLMDKADEPRIPLPPSPAPPSPTPPKAVAVAEVRQEEADEVDADLAAEAKAAVAAIAENEESTGEVANGAAASDFDGLNRGAAGKSDEPETAESGDAATKWKKSTDEESASDDEHQVGAKPDSTPAEIPAAKAASPPAPRPSWVDHPPKRVGETAREVIVTDEYASVDECTRATDVYLLWKTYERLMELCGRPVLDSELPSLRFQNNLVVANGANIISHDGGRTWNWSDDRIVLLKELGIGVNYVRREIVAKEATNDAQYFETVQRSFGPMHKLYTQIEFTPNVDQELLRRWEAHERKGRLAAVGAGTGGILGLLGIFYGLLKVDTWTKGYYTKRLFLGVPAAIIGLGALFALMVS